MSMKQSIKAARMARHQARMNRQSSLNLTSLMDIFTILVFFLMVNSSDVQVVKNTDTITMPESVADKRPKEGILLIQLDAESIKADGKVIATIAEVKAAKEDQDIAALDKLFADKAAAREAEKKELTDEEKAFGLPVMVQGDQKVPYVVLRKVIASAAKQNFRDVSLAVSQVPVKMSDMQQGGEL